MDVSFMYHGFGLRTVECSKTEYKDNGIVLKVQTREDNYVALSAEVRKSHEMVTLFAVSAVFPSGASRSISICVFSVSSVVPAVVTNRRGYLSLQASGIRHIAWRDLLST